MVALYVGLGIAMMTGISAMMQIGTNMNKIVIESSISNNYSYYAINACTKKDRIVTYLLYEGINWLTKNNYKIIHFGTFPKYVEGEKNINISKFKKAFCNKMFTQYYLEL